VLTIRVRAGDPEDAAILANALATEMIQLTAQGITRPEGELLVIEFARPATDPVAPQVSLLMLLAAAAGLIGALVLILLVEYFGDAVRSADDLAREAGAPLLGTVGVRKDVDLAAQVRDWRAAPDSEGSRGFQLVAARLAVAVSEANDAGFSESRSILVLDASRGGSRSAAAVTAAVGLASALARLGEHPVLVDGGASAGPLAEIAGLVDAPGVTEVIDGSAEPAAATGTLADLPLVPGGRGSTDRLAVEGCRMLVEGLTADAGSRVIVAAPSLRTSGAALVWARACDVALVVAEAGATRRSDVRHAVGSLPPEMPVLGSILVERRAVGGGLWQRLRPARPGATTAGSAPGAGGSAS
jgi:tyrosine-protein kinase Etk/Wzc